MDAAAIRGGVVAIGKFDGVHRGHQAVIDEARTLARQIGCPAAALTFEPHPRRYFQPDEPLFMLSDPETRLALLQAAGLDAVAVMTFDADLASQSAEAFVDNLLVERFGVRAVAVGHNFRFGKARAGTTERLKELGAQKGFEVRVAGPEGDGDVTFSSSDARVHLVAGELDEAAAILGYRWFFRAEVVHGARRGRDLGYPTANMRLDPECGLRHGVYAVRAMIDGRRLGGVANFGSRPQFDNGAPVFEVHMFDLSEDLYGKSVTVTPLAYLRAEQAFESVDALVAQMDADTRQARDIVAALDHHDPLADFPMSRALAAAGLT